jgi:hypothetical protein
VNPGRYVGVAPGQAHDAEEFNEKLEALQEQLETRLSVATPTPIISDTTQRGNLAPIPPPSPVEFQAPNTSAVGESS